MARPDHQKRQLNGILAICFGVGLPLTIATCVAAGELSRGTGGVLGAISFAVSFALLFRA